MVLGLDAHGTRILDAVERDDERRRAADQRLEFAESREHALVQSR